MKTKEKKIMNCVEANKIRIVGFLLNKGHIPAKNSGNDFWYCSPLRSEEKPSFKVNSVKNVWYDYGTGTGGKLIDLVRSLYNVDVSEALAIISGTGPAPYSFSFDPQNCPIEGIKIKHIQKLQNQALIQYTEKRKIPLPIADKYLKEVYYYAKNKKYFALAFPNDLGGYELRNKYYKNSNSPKAITTIIGSPGINSVNVFEGFMDFLTALVYYKTNTPTADTIILNGTGQVNKVLKLLPNYVNINLYLDNDTAGMDAAKQIQDKYPQAVNRSQIIYPGSKDFNEFIILK